MHDPSTSPDATESRAYVQALALADGETLRRVAGEVVPVLPDEWFGVSMFMSQTLHLTTGELDAMKRELAGVIERYRTGEPTEGADGGRCSCRCSRCSPKRRDRETRLP